MQALKERATYRLRLAEIKGATGKLRVSLKDIFGDGGAVCRAPRMEALLGLVRFNKMRVYDQKRKSDVNKLLRYSEDNPT